MLNFFIYEAGQGVLSVQYSRSDGLENSGGKFTEYSKSGEIEWEKKAVTDNPQGSFV